MDASLVSSSVGEMEIEIETSIDARYSFSDIANYLSRGTYPADANKATKSSLLKRSKFFTMESGHLHYVGGKVKKKPRLFVQSVDEQQRPIKTMQLISEEIKLYLNSMSATTGQICTSKFVIIFFYFV